MDNKTMKFMAAELVSAIRQHVTDRLVPVVGKQEAGFSMIRDLRADAEKLQQRIDMLESSVAELQRTLQLRRVA